MIEFEHATLRYQGAASPVLFDVNVVVPEGEMALVVGATGSGKSSLLSMVNGLVPHFTGGELTGRVIVAGRSTADHPPRELSDVVGMVRQDPQAGFVTDTVEDELAYTMESLAVPPDVMRRRVEETLDLLGLVPLRGRALRTLSGGEKQRVAIGSVLTAHPRVLVLDEPTSALDPQAAEDVLATVQRLVHDLGLTVLLSEHRLERVVQYADSVISVERGGHVRHDPSPAHAMRTSPVAPPVVELGRWAGWDPLPLSIRDARRAAARLRESLAPAEPASPAESDNTAPARGPVKAGGGADAPGGAPEVARVTRAVAAHGDRRVLNGVDLTLAAGEVVALMGRNGSGKSTLIGMLNGSHRPIGGTVRVDGLDPVGLSGRDLVTRVGTVPQDPGALLWAESAAAELRAADVDAGAAAGTAAGVLERLRPGLDLTSHPGDLSEGSRLALVLAIILAGDPQLLLLDEPTRGLDYPAKEALGAELRRRSSAGRSVVVATHDVELVAEVCSRVVMLADGEVVLDDEARAAATASPAFAPQVAKIMAPLPLLTAAEVRAAAQQEGPVASAGVAT